MRLLIEISSVVHYLRKDAEVIAVLDPFDNTRTVINGQKSVQRNCTTVEEAKKTADNFAIELTRKTAEFIKQELSKLPDAKP
jgi:hypothetical protein